MHAVIHIYVLFRGQEAWKNLWLLLLGECLLLSVSSRLHPDINLQAFFPAFDIAAYSFCFLLLSSVPPFMNPVKPLCLEALLLGQTPITFRPINLKLAWLMAFFPILHILVVTYREDLRVGREVAGVGSMVTSIRDGDDVAAGHPINTCEVFWKLSCEICTTFRVWLMAPLQSFRLLLLHECLNDCQFFIGW